MPCSMPQAHCCKVHSMMACDLTCVHRAICIGPMTKADHNAATQHTMAAAVTSPIRSLSSYETLKHPARSG